MTDFLFPDHWDTATRINVLASAGVALCCLTFLVMGYVRRDARKVSMDSERWAITLWLVTVMAFFATRMITVAIEGETITGSMLLAIVVGLMAASVITILVILRNHRDYELLTGMPQRRVKVKVESSDSDDVVHVTVAGVLDEEVRVITNGDDPQRIMGLGN